MKQKSNDCNQFSQVEPNHLIKNSTTTITGTLGAKNFFLISNQKHIHRCPQQEKYAMQLRDSNYGTATAGQPTEVNQNNDVSSIDGQHGIQPFNSHSDFTNVGNNFNMPNTRISKHGTLTLPGAGKFKNFFFNCFVKAKSWDIPWMNRFLNWLCPNFKQALNKIYEQMYTSQINELNAEELLLADSTSESANTASANQNLQPLPQDGIEISDNSNEDAGATTNGNLDNLQQKIDQDEKLGTSKREKEPHFQTVQINVNKEELTKLEVESKRQLQEIEHEITQRVQQILNIAQNIGAGSFGSVKIVSIEIMGHVIDVAIKVMNGAKNIGNSSASHMKYNLNDTKERKGYNTNGTRFSPVLSNLKSLDAQLDKLVRLANKFTRKIETTTLERLIKVKSQVSELVNLAESYKQISKNPTEGDIENIKSKFSQKASELETFTNDEIEKLGKFETSCDIGRELYMNAKLNKIIASEASKSGQKAIDWANENHLIVCFSATPPENENNNQSLLSFAYNKAQEVADTEDGSLNFSQAGSKEAKNLGDCYEDIINLAPEARLKLLSKISLAMSKLDKANIVHDDFYGSNIRVDFQNKDNPDVFIIDLGLSIDCENPTLFGNPLTAGSGQRFRFSSPEVYAALTSLTEESFENAAKNIFGVTGGAKCNSYALGTQVLPLLFGPEGDKISNEYFQYGCTNKIKDKLKKNISLSKYEKEILDLTEGKSVNLKETPNHNKELTAQYRRISYLARQQYFEDIESNARECNDALPEGKRFNEDQLKRAISLMQGLLEIDPEKRITSEEANKKLKN